MLRIEARWWMIAALLAILWLGMRNINADPIYGDEQHSFEDAGGGRFGPMTLPDVWTNIATTNAWHTPGFFMLLNQWGTVTGWTALALRMMALLLGLLTVAMTYRLGADWISPQVGICAALVLGTSALFVRYMDKVRMYTLMTFLTVFVLWAYLRVVDSERPPGLLLWFGLLAGTVALSYTHYFGFMPLAAIGLYHLLFAPKNRRWWQIVGVMALAAIDFLPWAAVGLVKGLSLATNATSLNARALHPVAAVRQLAEMFSGGMPVLLLVTAALAIRPQVKGVRLVWFFLLGSFGMSLLANQFVEVLSSNRLRYLITIWPLLALLVGIAVVHLWDLAKANRAARVLLSTAALGLWVGVNLTTSLTEALDADLDSGTTYMFPMHLVEPELRALAQPQDAVILYVPDGLASAVYWRHQDIRDFYFGDYPEKPIVTTTAYYEGEAAQERESRLNFSQGRQRVWVASMPDQPSASLSEFEAALGEIYAMCQPPAISQPSVRLDQYAPSPACCLSEASSRVSLAQYGDGIRLAALGQLPDDVGASLPVWMLWALDADVPPHEYSVSLQVLDADGNKVGQADYGLEPLAYTCQQTNVQVGDLPPGEYQLRATVYAWTTGERLPGLVTGTGEQGDLLPIGAFRISS
jgi:hypothetical protein